MKNNSTAPARVISQRVSKLKIEGQHKISKSKFMENAFLLLGLASAIFAIGMAVN